MIRGRLPYHFELGPPFIVLADILLLTVFVLILLGVTQALITNKEAWMLEDVRYRQEKVARQVQEVFGPRWGTEITMTADQKDQKFTFSDTVLFDLGSDELRPSGQSDLRKFAQVLCRNKDTYDTIRVEGHTCTVPIKSGRFRSNWHLSASRAVAVVEFLRKHNVPPQRMSANGLGEFQPVAPNHPKYGNPKNRRIEIVLVYEYSNADER